MGELDRFILLGALLMISQLEIEPSSYIFLHLRPGRGLLPSLPFHITLLLPLSIKLLWHDGVPSGCLGIPAVCTGTLISIELSIE